MLGTLVNCSAIIAGSLVGLAFKSGLPEKFQKTIMHAIALAVVLIGTKMALGCDEMLVIITSLVIGSVIGEWIGIEALLDKIADFLEQRFAKGSDTFAAGFVTASLIYCVGSMAVVGSLESGFLAKHDTLYAKSVLDGVVSIVLSASLGIGVIFSAIPVLIYQGAITLCAGVLKPFLVPSVISQMSATGGVLIIAIGLNMLREKKIKVGNMLPAIFIPLVYFFIKLCIREFV